MCALGFKERNQLAGNMLVATTMSNMGLHEAMQKAGIQVVTTDVGDRQVIEQMRKSGATVGGEKSGHVILMDYATTGDGIITALQVMRLMKQRKATLAELAGCMDEYPQTLVSFKVKEKKPIAGLPGLVRVMGKCEEDLGGTGRMIVRYSGTENKIRLLVEAKEQAKVDQWIAALTAAVHKELGA
jgi:phosphoglucosamine mutase